MTANYAAIGDPKATVLRRYFRSENETEKGEALVEIQEIMQTLVRILQIPSYLKAQLTDIISPSNHSFSSPAQIAPTVSAPTGQDKS